MQHFRLHGQRSWQQVLAKQWLERSNDLESAAKARVNAADSDLNQGGPRKS
jgi:hypothetical protein